MWGSNFIPPSEIRHFQTGTKLDFGHSGGMAERVGDALAEGWREFRGFD
jgi:hypothetical protein